jgi:hypothetical protein
VTIDDDAIMQLAAIGSRQSGFNHDIASKIQGLMMALDELTELIEPLRNEDLARSVDTAMTAVRELNQLLTASRALTKPPARTRIAVRELVTKAAERASVAVRGALPEVMVEVSAPMIIQALALAIDVAGGVGRSRVIEPRCEVAAGLVELSFTPATNLTANASTQLAIASWVLRREGGELERGERIAIRLPAVT